MNRLYFIKRKIEQEEFEGKSPMEYLHSLGFRTEVRAFLPPLNQRNQLPLAFIAWDPAMKENFLRFGQLVSYGVVRVKKPPRPCCPHSQLFPPTTHYF